MNEDLKRLLIRKNIITLVIVGIALVVIPIAVILVNTQIRFRSKAGIGAVTFTGPGVTCDTAGSCTTTSSTVQLELRSPLGPPAP